MREELGRRAQRGRGGARLESGAGPWRQSSVGGRSGAEGGARSERGRGGGARLEAELGRRAERSSAGGRAGSGAERL